MAVQRGVIGSLRDTYQSGARGLRAAGDKLCSGANSVQRGLLAARGDTVSVSPEARRAAAGEGGVITGLVDMRLARYAASASLAVLRTADAMAAAVLDDRTR